VIGGRGFRELPPGPELAIGQDGRRITALAGMYVETYGYDRETAGGDATRYLHGGLTYRVLPSLTSI
jgi:hypothetical protein